MNVRRAVALCAAALLIPATALAQGAAPKAPQWYEQVTGVLAIPAAIIGLAAAWILIGKNSVETRKAELEIQKLELELREKRSVLVANNDHEPSEATKLVTAIFDANRTILQGVSKTLQMLLRFAVLSVAMGGWGEFHGLSSEI
jgi:hypothetical protein